MSAATATPRLSREELRGLILTGGQGARCVHAAMIPVDEAPVVPYAVLRESGQLREAYVRGGHADLEAVHELVDRGVRPAGGGSMSGGSMAFSHNLPEPGTFVMDQGLFNRQTERNDMPLENKAFTGLNGARMDQRISNIGILTGLQVILEGSLVVAGTGTVTAKYPWPWAAIDKFSPNLNGQTSLISCEGPDLRARRNRIYRNPRDHVSTAPATDATTIDANPGVIANGTYNVVLVYEIPIVHDLWSLTGGIFAQSDATYLSFSITPAQTSKVFALTGDSTATLNATVKSSLTFYDIPSQDTPKGRLVVVPDLRWLHGFLASDQSYQSTGEVKFPFIRTAGQLLAYYFFLDNGGSAFLDPAALNEIRLEYGGNRRPRVYAPVTQLLDENSRDFNGMIRPSARYSVFDFEGRNPEREIVYPKGVVELAAVATIPTGTTINSNAKAHFVEETLFTGR